MERAAFKAFSAPNAATIFAPRLTDVRSAEPCYQETFRIQAEPSPTAAIFAGPFAGEREYISKRTAQMNGLTKDYYLPRLEFIPGVNSPTQFESKFGGLPRGVSAERWPRCAHCGSIQSLLAQLRHDPPRLDLDRPGRILYVFQCPRWYENGCDSFDPTSGANACFVLEPEEICDDGSVNSVASQLAHLETRVLSWEPHVETLREEFVADYFDPMKWRTLPIDEHYAISLDTKLGGIPFWGNVGPSDIPAGKWRFVLQMRDTHYIPGEKSEAAAAYLSAMNMPALRDESRPGWNCPWANFGQGVGYVFLSEQGPMRGVFTWQRL